MSRKAPRLTEPEIQPVLEIIQRLVDRKSNCQSDDIAYRQEWAEYYRMGGPQPTVSREMNVAPCASLGA